MKKLLGICMVVLALCAFGITSANAAGPWCIDLSPSGYCDLIEVSRDGSLNLYGIWDGNCDGSFSIFVQGSAIGGLNNLVGYNPNFGYQYQMYFNVPARTLDFWAYDGVNPPALWFTGLVWKITPGACPHSASESGLPSLADF